MVDFLFAFDFGRLVGEGLRDAEGEGEEAGFVEAFVRLQGEGEVEDVVGVGEVRGHGCGEGELGEVCWSFRLIGWSDEGGEDGGWGTMKGL